MSTDMMLGAMKPGYGHGHGYNTNTEIRLNWKT